MQGLGIQVDIGNLHSQESRGYDKLPDLKNQILCIQCFLENWRKSGVFPEEGSIPKKTLRQRDRGREIPKKRIFQLASANKNFTDDAVLKGVSSWRYQEVFSRRSNSGGRKHLPASDVPRRVSRHEAIECLMRNKYEIWNSLGHYRGKILTLRSSFIFTIFTAEIVISPIYGVYIADGGISISTFQKCAKTERVNCRRRQRERTGDRESRE